MNEIGSVLFLYTETPLHAGSGVALGAVDLPIQRERSTKLPTVQGSGIKGSLRQQFRDKKEAIEDGENLVLQLFGPEPAERKSEQGTEESEREEFAGALSVQDARLLLLPVRTVWGGFAWVTSPLILERLARDLSLAGLETPGWCKDMRKACEGLNAEDAFVGMKSTVHGDGRVLIEDLDYRAAIHSWVDAVAAWLKDNALPKSDEYEPFRNRLPAQLTILQDQEMKFWSEHATEVVARIRIDPNTGTVKDGALWSEESLPAESVLWSPTFLTVGRRPPGRDSAGNQRPAHKRYDDPRELRERFAHEVGSKGLMKARLRLGGDRTVGRGIVGVRLMPEKRGA